MLLMVEKDIRGGICHSIYRYAKANNKYIKDYDKNKGSLHIQHLDGNNVYDWSMSQKLSIYNFDWIKDISQLNQNITKNIMKKVIKDIFLKLMLNIWKNYRKLILIYHF